MASAFKRAKELRQNGTDAERRLWQKLRNRQLTYKFYRQFPVKGYIADFACPELWLIIEVDGGQHAENEKDIARTNFLNSLGFEVIRFWNNDVLGNIDGVLDSLKAALLHRQSTLVLPKEREQKEKTQ